TPPSEDHQHSADSKITTLQTQRTRRSTLHVYLYLALHWNPYADKGCRIASVAIPQVMDVVFDLFSGNRVTPVLS
ncbi:hypothetical protein AB0F17_18250, partial [Nonomuraea sp. NPDC026600]|uniref:hypothetical protein n=1 Tax=Nonomuraea sp. NPDC026600 TaxID=3155363 RepID=UPI0033D73DA4